MNKNLRAFEMLRAGLMASCVGLPVIPITASAQTAPASPSAGQAPVADEQADQATVATPAVADSDIVVVARGQGTRDARVNNLQTVDAVGPKDIDSMPSQNLSDVLKRLPGVQVTYDNGEAQQPNIRGVGFIQTTVDGRETVTANARALQIGDLPGDVVNSVEVFKTPSANLIEGGIGGLIAVKTRSALSYPKPQATGQLSMSMDDKRGKILPQGSIAVGGTWNTGIGRIGASLGVAHTAVLLRSDFFISNYAKTANVFDINRNGVLGDAADTAIVPSFALPIQIEARHARDSVIGNLQWAPSEELTLSGSYFKGRYLDTSQQYSLVAAMPTTTNSAANAGSFTAVDKSPVALPVVRGGTYASVPLTAQSLYVRPFRSVTQASGSAEWAHERLTISAQGDFTKSQNNNDILIFAAAGTAPNLIYNGATSPDRGSISVTGTDIKNPATFTTLSYNQIIQRNDSTGNSQRFDVEYRPGGFLTALQLGYRRTYRRSTANQGTQNQQITGTLATIPGLSTPSPDGDFVVANPNLFENKLGFLSKVGLAPRLPAFAQASFFRLRERTDAVYARAVYAFDLGGLPVDGDIGIRGVRNQNRGDAFAVAASGNTPIQNKGTTTDWLPSATIRAKLTEHLTARLSGSRTVARPNFTSLSPGLTLNADLTGASGNPNLKSFYANGIDAGLDWLFSPSGYVTVAVFGKTLKGLVQNNVTQQVVNGLTYRISRPINGTSDSSFKGVEINVNKKFVELPGILSGLGFDGNYTYLDSQMTNTSGMKTQIPGLAKHTVNTSVYYDKGPILVRLGYTLTTDFVNNPNYGGPTELGGAEIFGKQEVVDATLQYRVNEYFRLTANLMNALQPAVGYYNGYEQTPDNSYRTYRRYQFGMKFDF